MESEVPQSIAEVSRVLIHYLDQCQLILGIWAQILSKSGQGLTLSLAGLHSYLICHHINNHIISYQFIGIKTKKNTEQTKETWL